VVGGSVVEGPVVVDAIVVVDGFGGRVAGGRVEVEAEVGGRAAVVVVG
jgi:hypothetical protein